MLKRNKFIILGIVVVVLAALVMAADFTPQGNINMRWIYNITGVPWINATIYHGNGSQLTDVCQSSGAGCPSGLVDTWWSLTGIYIINNSNTLDMNETQFNATIDSRMVAYNETDLINAVNTTGNIQALLNGTGIYSTFNSTYSSFAYNETSIVLTVINNVNNTANIQALLNATGIYSTYNSTYAQWAYNQTYSGSTYNATYDQWAYNQTYSGSTYNASYDEYSYNMTSAIDYNYNQTLSSGGAHLDITGFVINVTNSITDWLYNQTSAAFASYGKWWYNQSAATFNTYGKWFYNMSDGSYNVSYEEFAHNQTYSGSTYNASYADFDYNETSIILALDYVLPGDNVTFNQLNVSDHFRINEANITCFNLDCTWFANATDSCNYWPSGGKDCGAA